MLDAECYGWKEIPEIRLRIAGRVIATFKALKNFSENYIANSQYSWGKWQVSFEDALFSPYSIEEIIREEEPLYLDVIREVRSIDGQDEVLTTTYNNGYLSSFSNGVDCGGDPSVYSYSFVFKTRKTN